MNIIERIINQPSSAHPGKPWILKSKDGKKVLGRFASKAAAIKREKQIKAIVAAKKK